MNLTIRLLIATTLLLGSGCARTDWIERTLVTEDVTGKWEGNVGGVPYASPGGILMELEQQGSTVKGFIRYGGATATSGGRVFGGPIEGAVTGDVFRFRDTRGNAEGELTISGDEMNGTASISGTRPISLRRVDSSSPSATPPR